MFSGHVVNGDFQNQCIAGILHHISIEVIFFRDS